MSEPIEPTPAEPVELEPTQIEVPVEVPAGDGAVVEDTAASAPSTQGTAPPVVTSSEGGADPADA